MGMHMALAPRVLKLKSGPVGTRIRARMAEFYRFHAKPDEDWFCELCFCLLTANSTAKLGLCIQSELGFEGFMHWPLDDLYSYLKPAGHRFWNQRAERIVKARAHWRVKTELCRVMEGAFNPGARMGPTDLRTVPLYAAEAARQWLVSNIEGLGLKESSHFLRNVGLPHFAINDRHIVNVLVEHRLTKRPTSLTPRAYYDLEDAQRNMAEMLGMPVGELDLYLWYLKTGEVLK